jgi:hypothetical protein
MQENQKEKNGTRKLHRITQEDFYRVCRFAETKRSELDGMDIKAAKEFVSKKYLSISIGTMRSVAKTVGIELFTSRRPKGSGSRKSFMSNRYRRVASILLRVCKQVGYEDPDDLKALELMVDDRKREAFFKDEEAEKNGQAQPKTDPPLRGALIDNDGTRLPF